MKKFTYILIVALIGIVVVRVQPVLAREPHQSFKLIGSWTVMLNATDSDGNPCPIVPVTLEFFTDQTMTMSNNGGMHLPFKTSFTRLERHVIEEINPGLKGRNLLLILPTANFTWAYTPMAYAYTIEKNELTLMLRGLLPAKFTRVVK